MWQKLLQKAGIKPTGDAEWVLKSTVVRLVECSHCGRETYIFWEQRYTTNLEHISLPGHRVCTVCAETEAQARKLVEENDTP